MRTLRTHGGGRSSSWNSTLGKCVSPDTYHITNILDAGEQFDVRLRFHAGTPESMVEYIGEYSFPRSEVAQTRFLELEYANGALTSPVPLPAYWLTLHFADGRTAKMGELMPSDGQRIIGMSARNRCLIEPVTIEGKIDRVEAILYSEQHYKKQSFNLHVTHR